MTRRTLGRSCAAILLALMMGTLSMEASLASTGSATAASEVRSQDADGDGIPDDLDPDDNNDGKPDSDQGGEGTSSGNDPLPDSDTDGITDDMDPDDNNNGVTDENEPIPAPSGGTGSSPGSPSNPGSPSGSGSESTEPQPLVRALPTTGSGQAPSDVTAQIAAVMGLSATLLAGAAMCRTKIQQAP